MLHDDHLRAEKTRRAWVAGMVLALAAELGGAVLIFTGHQTPGVIIAVLGIIGWMTARSLGGKRYTALCTELRLRHGLGLRDMVPVDAKELSNKLPLFPLLPSDAENVTRPLMLHAWRGQWQERPTTISETTVGFGPDPKRRQFLTGTLLEIGTACSVPGLMVIYGQPYGGMPLSRWQGMEHVSTGERKYLLLAKTGTEVSEYTLDALAAFGTPERSAILWTEKERVFVFLPTQFYSGNWTLAQPMPESAMAADPLPALSDLPKLLKKLA